MFGSVAALVASIFALQGAPPVPVACGPIVDWPAPPGAVLYGLTWFETPSVNGWLPSRVELVPSVCGGLLLLSVDATTRARVAALNPYVSVTQLEGVGALVTLHELHHATGDRDETSTECAALALLPAFLGRYLSGQDLQRALMYASVFDVSLGATYHERTC